MSGFVILLEGIDGSGKTTISNFLAEKKYLDNQKVLLAPRLGCYLPCGDSAENFAKWVTTNCIKDINESMLEGSYRRMLWVSEKALENIVVVDRGPITVYSSCISRCRIDKKIGIIESINELNLTLDKFPLYPFQNNKNIVSIILRFQNILDVKKRIPFEFSNKEYGNYLSVLLDSINFLCNKSVESLILDAHKATFEIKEKILEFIESKRNEKYFNL